MARILNIRIGCRWLIPGGMEVWTKMCFLPHFQKDFCLEKIMLKLNIMDFMIYHLFHHAILPGQRDR